MISDAAHLQRVAPAPTSRSTARASLAGPHCDAENLKIHSHTEYSKRKFCPGTSKSSSDSVRGSLSHSTSMSPRGDSARRYYYVTGRATTTTGAGGPRPRRAPRYQASSGSAPPVPVRADHDSGAGATPGSGKTFFPSFGKKSFECRCPWRPTQWQQVPSHGTVKRWKNGEEY